MRGVVLDESVLSGSAPHRVSADDEPERILQLRRPFLHGSDVERLQKALHDRGFLVEIDAIFGPATEMAVLRFQRQQGMRVDGIVGPATRAELFGGLRLSSAPTNSPAERPAQPRDRAPHEKFDPAR